MDEGYASKLVQYGWETVTEALKHGGITKHDGQACPIRAKIRAFELSEQLKEIWTPLYNKHMDDIHDRFFL